MTSTTSTTANGGASTGSNVLRALLNLSRLEVGGVKPDFAPVSVHELLQSLRRDFETQAASKGLRLEILPTRAGGS